MLFRTIWATDRRERIPGALPRLRGRRVNAVRQLLEVRWCDLRPGTRKRFNPGFQPWVVFSYQVRPDLLRSKGWSSLQRLRTLISGRLFYGTKHLLNRLKNWRSLGQNVRLICTVIRWILGSKRPLKERRKLSDTRMFAV